MVKQGSATTADARSTARSDEMTDREKLIDMITNAPFGVNKQTAASWLGSSAIAEIADHLLANGVVVQKHGRWKDGKCSVCGEEEVSYSLEEPVYDYDWEENLQFCGTETHECYIPTPYCPHCGAKMSKEGE